MIVSSRYDFIESLGIETEFIPPDAETECERITGNLDIILTLLEYFEASREALKPAIPEPIINTSVNLFKQ